MIERVVLAKQLELKQRPTEDEAGNNRRHGRGGIGSLPKYPQRKNHREWRRNEEKDGLNFFEQSCLGGGEINREPNACREHRRPAPAAKTDLLVLGDFALHQLLVKVDGDDRGSGVEHG